MGLGHQILWGTLFLGLCFAIEILLLAACTQWIRVLGVRWRRRSALWRNTGIVGVALLVIVLAHTLQVWIWAVVWVMFEVLADWNEAIYFSLVTYTTLGYGDVVLEPGTRIFGAFASVTGILAIGLSTAFLVAMMARLFEGRMIR
ncbi:ion channel [Lutimaribacter marinistellae]|uniref:Ion channel n=1 Tax=Lutimaribacter marinistellae TaxID=1820329 RepID=A0ABV7TM98_9RHOB